MIRSHKTIRRFCKFKSRMGKSFDGSLCSVLEPTQGTPVLSLSLQLGAENCLVKTISVDCGATLSHHDHHYLIASYGCSSRIFSVIPQSCDGKYQMLLATTQIVNDFVLFGDKHGGWVDRLTHGERVSANKIGGNTLSANSVICASTKVSRG